MVADCGKVESPGGAGHQTESQHQVTLVYWNEQENFMHYIYHIAIDM